MITILWRKEVYDNLFWVYLILKGGGVRVYNYNISEYISHSVRILINDLFNTWKFQQIFLFQCDLTFNIKKCKSVFCIGNLKQYFTVCHSFFTVVQCKLNHWQTNCANLFHTSDKNYKCLENFVHLSNLSWLILKKKFSKYWENDALYILYIL